MDLFDFFFPEQATAHHLRKMASKRAGSASLETAGLPNDEISCLREDVNFLTLVVAALLRRLSETETASPTDIQDIIDEIDALDGVADGGLAPGNLRGMLGVLRNDPVDSKTSKDEFKIETTPRYRNR